MRLLICTQTTDPTDPTLGFFARWIDEFKKHCEVEVIELRDLGRGGKLARALRLNALARSKKYDAVFVHMNPEYLIAAGWYWRLRGIRTALWYTHKAVNWRLRVAVWFADIVFTASQESFRLRTPKLRVVGHGIDTDFFTPGGERSREVLSVGRLNKSKRHDLVIQAMQYTHRELWLAGEGPERTNLEKLARESAVGSRVHFLGARMHAQLRELYRRAGVFVHTSETGSLDKVVLEALACNCPVVTTSKSLGDVPALVVDPVPAAIAHAIEHPPAPDRDYVVKTHSLSALIPRIVRDIEVV